MDVEIHPNAKKHLTEKQVLSAWLAVTECIRRESKDEPPRWLAIGWLSDGRSVELVAVELVLDAVDQARLAVAVTAVAALSTVEPIRAGAVFMAK